jgi:hypothetical protein
VGGFGCGKASYGEFGGADVVDKAVLIIMAYTGWTKENATAAVAKWRWLDPTWNAAYFLRYLSPSERAWVERQGHAVESEDAGCRKGSG